MYNSLGKCSKARTTVPYKEKKREKTVLPVDENILRRPMSID